MFSIVDLFIKKTFISFYIEENKFYTQKIFVKKNKIIQKDEQIFENEQDFLKFINLAKLENTQLYISTIINNFNQGIIESCSHKIYKQKGINIENLKILCIDNKYSIYIGIFELQEFKKEIKKYSVDLIYSPFLIIDLNKTKSHNTLYFLAMRETLVIVIYYKKIPIYSSIQELKLDEENNEHTTDELSDIDIDSVEEIEELDDVENLDDIDSLENLDDLDNIEEIEDLDHLDDLQTDNQKKENINDLKYQTEILKFIQSSIKEYYENYSDDFIENIYFFKTYEFNTDFLKEIENELFLDVTIQNINILNEINALALKDINV